MRHHGLMIPAFLLLNLTLGAQSGGEPRIISPYVSDLQVSTQEGQVILTWTDTQDVEAPVYLVYRSDREITRANLDQATLVTTVGQGEEKATDQPATQGRYFYAVLAKDSSGKIWQQFLPYRNKTVTAQEFTPPPPPEPKPQTTPPSPQEVPPQAPPSPAQVPPEEKTLPAPQPPAAPPAPVPTAVSVAPDPVPVAVTVPAAEAPKGLAVADSKDPPTSPSGAIKVDTARPLALPGRRLGTSQTSVAPPLDPETSKVLGSLLKSQGRERESLPALKIFPEEASPTPGTGTQKDLHSLVRSHFLQGKWTEGAQRFTSLAAKETDRSRQARAFYYAGQSYLKAGDSRSALVNFLQARRSLPEAQAWADILLTPGVQNLPLKDLLPLEVEGATEEMLRPLSAQTKSTVTILEETTLLGQGSFKKSPVPEPQKKSWISLAETLTDSTTAAAYEQSVEKAQTEGVLDQLVAALEGETSRRDASPGVHFALSLAYGRLGLLQKSYQSVVSAIQRASAPGTLFNLAMANGRRDLLGGLGKGGGATLEVKSTPAGATVRLNGQELGPTPVTLEGLPPGNHQLEIYRLLYAPKTLTVSLAAGDRKEVDVGLGPLKDELTPPEEFTGRGTPEIRVPLGHSGEISALVFTPDSKKLITGSTDGGIRIWSTADRMEVQNLPGHFGRITDLKLTPDGRILGSTSWDGSVKLWDLETGDLIFTLVGHTNMVSSLDFSRDGQKVATGSWDTTVRVWSVTTGELLSASKPLGTGLSDAVWAAQESIAALDQNGTLTLWDTASPDTLRSLPGAYSGGDGRLFWDQGTGRLVVLPPTSGTPILIDPAAMKSAGSLEGSFGSFVSEPNSPENGRILVLRRDGQGKTRADFRLLNRTAVVLKELSLPGNLDRGLLSPDSSLIVGTSGPQLLWFHAESAESLTRTFPLPGLSDISVISPLGNFTALRTQETLVSLVDALTGIPAGQWESKATVTSLAFTADGAALVMGMTSGQVSVVDLQTKAHSPPLSLGSAEVRQILPMGPGGQILVLLSNGTLHRVDAKSASLQRSFTTVPQARRMAADRNGLWLTVQSTGNDLTLFDLSTERQTMTLPKHQAFINDFLFTSDGKELILADNRGSLSLLSLDSGEKAREIFQVRSPVEKIALSGNILAAGALDSTITLWNLAENTRGRTLLGHLEGITSLSFDKSGKLFSSGRDRVSILWNGTTGAHLYFQILNRNDGSYLTWIREGYYTGRGGLEERMVNLVDRSLVVPLSQLAFTYKREDVVAARLQERDILPLLRNK